MVFSECSGEDSDREWHPQSKEALSILGVSIRLYIHNTRQAAASALHYQDFFCLETTEQLWPLVYSQGACVWNGEYLIPVWWAQARTLSLSPEASSYLNLTCPDPFCASLNEGTISFGHLTRLAALKLFNLLQLFVVFFFSLEFLFFL